MCIAYSWDGHSTTDDRIRKANCKFTLLILISIVVNVFLFIGLAIFLAFYITLWSFLAKQQRFTEPSPAPYGVGALPHDTKQQIELHCIGVPKFIMWGLNRGTQRVSQDNYNFLTNNMNKLLEEEKADKIREQYKETLPFDKEMLFLVFVVSVLLLALSAGISF